MTAPDIDYSSLKRLCAGSIFFHRIIEENRYYIDKTPYIKKIFKDDSSRALVIARPRFFGKSLARETFSEFLRINPENPEDTYYQDVLFKDTKIYEDRDFCREYMGRFPVISITFTRVDALNFERARVALANAVSKAALEHHYLMQSPLFSSDELEDFKILQDHHFLGGSEYQSKLEQSLLTLTRMLCRYYGKRVVLLIDEYDVPILKAYKEGYHEKMVALITSLFLNALKDNPYLEKAVLMGHLCLPEESVAAGLTNIEVNTVVNDHGYLAECMGFTADEVQALLDYYGLNEYEALIKKWYGGYRIGDSEIFCPLDVAVFCQNTIEGLKRGLPARPHNDWIDTSKSRSIQDYMSCIDEKEAEHMQTLLDGGEIEFKLNEHICHSRVEYFQSADEFWSLLLYNGYLALVKKEDSPELGTVCTARIPNEAVKAAFRYRITNYYQRTVSVMERADEFISALADGNAARVSALLQDMLSEYVSVCGDDDKADPEDYYQRFLNLMFTVSSNQYFDFESRTCAADDVADFSFRGRALTTLVVIDIKAGSDKDKLYELAQDALKQIDDKNCLASIFIHPREKVFCYGISFCRKHCCVVCEQKPARCRA